MATHTKKHTKLRGTKELVTKDESLGERYGEVIRPTGDCRFDCKLLDGSTVNAILKGSLIRGPNKQRIMVGDFILLQAIECHTEKDKYYIIHKYTADDKKKLAKNGELTLVSTSEKVATVVAMEGDVTSTTLATETEVDDDFIDNI